MRQRGVKNREQIIDECREYIAEFEPGKARNIFPEDKPLFLEVGSGKGRFITETAKAHPECNFLACEGGNNIYIRILQKAKDAGLDNLKVITDYIERPCEVFAEGELDGIYLNFSDPWPKDRHYKRRLTYREKLADYQKICKPGSFLRFKTDNDALFEFSLEEIEACGLKIAEITRDLHASEWAADNIMTEYEEKFSAKGAKINYVKVVL